MSSYRRFFPLSLNLQILPESDGHAAVLLTPFIYVEWIDAYQPNVRVEVPAGFETDFNSVPRGLWNFFPPWEYPEAAVIHDYLYRHPAVTHRRDADRIHRHIMKILGAPWWLRWSAWVALRSFGWIPWKDIPATGDL